MQKLRDTYAASHYLHHAYLLVGDTQIIIRELVDFLREDAGITVTANPDFWHRKFLTFGIDHARDLAQSQTRKAFSENKFGNKNDTTGSKKIFIIETDIITEEAQNALLKIFEEPSLDTHFFIISPQDIIISTLRSRMHVILYISSETSTNTATEQTSQAKLITLLDMSFSERLKLVAKITKGIADEEKTKQDAIAFINNIESEVYKKDVQEFARVLTITENARISLYDRGAPIKLILEYVILAI